MPIAYLSRRARFSASHRLHSKELSDEENQTLFGKCHRDNGHGHNYVFEVILKGEIDPRSGIVMDLSVLKKIIEEQVLEDFDHRHLNLDVVEFKDLNPTVENIARVIWDRLSRALPKGLLHEVKVHETENNVAYYREE